MTMAGLKKEKEMELVVLARSAGIGRVLPSPHKPPAVVGDAYRPEIDLYIEGVERSTKFYQHLRSRFGRDFATVAIEIQGEPSRKHRMGDLINAALNADVGLVVCGTDKEREQCERIARYVRHYNLLGDRPLPLILTEEEFMELLRDVESSPRKPSKWWSPNRPIEHLVDKRLKNK